MKTQQLKTELRRLKSTLKGKTLRVSLNGIANVYGNLKDFGNRILELEAKGCTFSIEDNDYTRVYADNGINMEKLIASFGTSA